MQKGRHASTKRRQVTPGDAAMLPFIMLKHPITIISGEREVSAQLNDSETAAAIWDALPITGLVQTWGDEIYFSIPLSTKESDDAQETVPKGTIAYWPPGNALCLFWGPTPISRGDEIRPASAVNLVGQIEGDLTLLAKIPHGSNILVRRAA